MSTDKINAPRAEQQKVNDRRTFSQYAAILIFIVLTILLCFSVQYGFQNDDETTCIAGAHRIMLGELPLIKNWTVIQLHSFLEYLPFRLVYAINGGTEGIVLGLRYCYVAVKMVFFAVICFTLRRYRYWAILCAVIFTVFHPIDFQSLTYYNVSILCAFSVGLLLFGAGKQCAFSLTAAGIAFACCVLAEPPVILIYLVFTLSVPVLCLTAKKQHREGLAGSRFSPAGLWGWITVGAAAVACAVFAAVLSSAGLKTVLANAPGVLRLLEFRPQTNQWEKYSDYFFKTGYACNIAAAALLALTGALKTAGKLQKARGPLFAVACLVYLWITAELFFRWGKIQSVLYLPVYLPIPLCFLGLSSFLLANKKQKRVFAFFCFGLAFAFCMDLFSRATVCTGGIVSAPAAVLLFRGTLLENFALQRGKGQPKQGARKKEPTGGRLLNGATRAFSALALLTLIVSVTAYSFHARFFPSPEVMTKEPLSEHIACGPMKGLITIPTVKEEYDSVLRDMDRLKEDPPRSLFVADFMLWCNLYLDLPYATFGQDSFDTPLSQDCLLFYWSLHPDEKPDCVYIPFFGCDNYREHTEQTQTVLSFMKSVCEYKTEKGEAGYILRILRWK